MFRVNVQIAPLTAITAGEGKPGGTSGVIFIDSADGNKLKLVMPDGSVRTAKQGEAPALTIFFPEG